MLMFRGKCPYLKKPKPAKIIKETKKEKQGEMEEIGRLHLRTVSLEQQLRLCQQMNSTYLQQIKGLEEDNLALCTRLHQLKVDQQGHFRQYLQQRESLKEEIKELVKVISFLEQEIQSIKVENDNMKPVMEEMRAEAQAGKTAVLRLNQTKAELQRNKVKLLESERYWITRCQTLLSEQQATHEKVLLEKDSEFNLKMKQLSQELTLRNQEVQEKTSEIYKLIQHIHSLAP